MPKIMQQQDISGVGVPDSFSVKRILVITIIAIFINYPVRGNENIAVKEFFINFVMLSGKTEVGDAVNIEVVKREVDILNTYFVSSQRKSLVRFRFKAYHPYDEIKNSECEFIRLGDFAGTYESEYWQNLFNSCNDARVVDKAAINFYIYDSYSPGKGFADKDSHGKNNRHRPYIILDWERLNHRIQNPEEHEMGHAFGLSHVCAPGARIDTHTNIMASKECGKGSGGKRDIGFDATQTAIILRNAEKISKELGRKQ